MRLCAAGAKCNWPQGNVELLEDLRRRIQVQVDVGEAARLELTRAEAEVASARIAVRSAELRSSAALSNLYAAVGAPLGPVEPDGDLQRPQILPTLDELQQEMLSKHPTTSSSRGRDPICRGNGSQRASPTASIPQRMDGLVSTTGSGPISIRCNAHASGI